MLISNLNNIFAFKKMYKLFIRPILFLFHPEFIHNFIIAILKIAGRIPFVASLTRFLVNTKVKPVELWGLKFKHPVGLAAGLDKDAEAFEMFGALGFSFVEIGTLTPKAQPGNPKPRVFRLPKDKALINRMGFNNSGILNAISHLKKRNKKTGLIIGGNIGKNKVTPNEKALDDYLYGLRHIHAYVDYITINISSPNTPNLRELQNKEELEKLIKGLSDEKKKLQINKPLLLKIAPDLSFSQIDEILDIILKYKIDGIIATNTTIGREVENYEESFVSSLGNGGLSGKPLSKKSTEIIKYISNKTDKKLPIIGVGGIMNKEDAIEKLKAGASLVQLYTGFIYEGPALIKNITSILS